MGIARAVRRFSTDCEGNITVLMLFLVPAFFFFAGAAIDISKLNAQRRYVQAQADLSALSAAQRLPESPVARGVAGTVTARNTVYGVQTLTRGQVQFGTFTAVGGFSLAADQDATAGIDAVRVIEQSPFRPIVLAPFFGDARMYVMRSATAVRRDVMSLTLRNVLVGLDTGRSVLDPLLGDELWMNAAVLGYQGLAVSQIDIHDLLGIVRAEAGARALTWDELLDTQIETKKLLDGLAERGLIPSGALGGNPGLALKVSDLISVTPGSIDAYSNAQLPDVGISVLDLLGAVALLSGKQTHDRIAAGVAANAAPLATTEVGLSMIDPGRTAIGYANRPSQPLTAQVAQIDTSVAGSFLGLVRVQLDFAAAPASAQVLSLDCNAGPTDTLARISVSTALASVGVKAQLLQNINDTPPQGTASATAIAGGTQVISVRGDQLGQPIAVSSPILLSNVIGAVGDSLTALGESMDEDHDTPVGTILGATLAVAGDLLGSVSTLAANQPLIDSGVQTLLDLAGIQLAQAQVIVNGYSCNSGLVE